MNFIPALDWFMLSVILMHAGIFNLFIFLTIFRRLFFSFLALRNLIFIVKHNLVEFIIKFLKKAFTNNFFSILKFNINIKNINF